MASVRSFLEAGRSFADMAAASPTHGVLFTRARARAEIPADLLARLRAIPGTWRLLAISEDWCLDSQNVLPWVAALAEATDRLSLRLVARDDHPALMDAHLTNGVSRSIPVIVIADAAGEELAWWGPRPAALRALVAAPWSALEKPDRLRQIRRWYAQDGGRAILEELVALLEQVAADGATPGVATA